MKNLLCLLLLVFSVNVQTTEQVPDYLIYDNQALELQINPLEEFFEKFPNRRIKGGPVSSGNRRGYVATFEFKENILTLNEMISENLDNDGVIKKSIIQNVFPDPTERALVWYSGVLVIPVGEMKNYVHLDYASNYENYILLKISNGNLVQSKKFTLSEYQQFKQKMFQLYKQTKEYKKLYKKLSKYPDKDFDLEGFIYQRGNFYQYVNVEL